MQSNCKGNKKSLLIGINYSNAGYGWQLDGCINDVKNIKNFLLARGFSESPSHMRVLTDCDKSDPTHQPTKGNIIEGMEALQIFTNLMHNITTH